MSGLECVPVKSTDGIYIIYTKRDDWSAEGRGEDSGGHAVGLHLSISYLFGIHGPGDVVSVVRRLFLALPPPPVAA